MLVDDAKQQFSKLLSIVKEKRQEFLDFNHASESYWLDYFFMNHIGHKKCLEKLVKVLKIILTLLYGQAFVKRGFSVNKSLLVENLSTQSLLSCRCVYDYMKSKNLTPENFIICGALRKSVRGSRTKYENYLEEQRKAKSSNEEALKRKAVQEYRYCEKKESIAWKYRIKS